MTKRQRREIWLRAAESIFTGKAMIIGGTIPRTYWDKMDAIFGVDMPHLGPFSPENQLARQIALLLMREMEE